MTDMPEKKLSSGMVTANAEQGSQLFSEVIGTSFLGLLTLILLFALLRAQKRNRDLMRELMKATLAQQKTS